MTDDIVILIPAYNEAAGIGAVVAQAREYGPVLVVDDGSTDDTAAQAEKAGADVLGQWPNGGKGVALRRGFAEAMAAGYKAVVMLDGDGQHKPAEIPRFIELYRREQPHLIIGRRNFDLMPRRRKLSNAIGTGIFSWAVGHRIYDSVSGFRLVSSELLPRLLEAREPGFLYELEMITICIESGYRLSWTPISTIYGDETSHINSLPHLWESLTFALRARQRRGWSS